MIPIRMTKFGLAHRQHISSICFGSWEYWMSPVARDQMALVGLNILKLHEINNWTIHKYYVTYYGNTV